MKIIKNKSLKEYNTFGIDVSAKNFAEIESYEDIIELLNKGYFAKDYFILGCGSNVLFSKDYDGFIAHINIKGVKIVDENDEYVLIEAGAGESWEQFVEKMIESGYYGLENLAMIPGSVGAAPVQNIGAYGAEQKDFFHELKCIDLLTGQELIMQPQDCLFGYRNSVFKQDGGKKYIVCSVVYKLNKIPKINITYRELNSELIKSGIEKLLPDTIFKVVSDLRHRKLPDYHSLGNAGSFFKNPIITVSEYEMLLKKYSDLPSFKINDNSFKILAAWLIEQCGWKGKRQGDAGVYEKHALILINYGNASGSDVLKLAADVEDSVFEKFNIKLEPEVIII
jgi:UDP-N-acetylmuramate dehydrogenase